MALINVGLIGAGNYGRTQLKFIDLIEDFQLISVCDVDPSAIEKTKEVTNSKFKAYSCYKEMLADPDLDAVFITTPNSRHEEQAIAALEAGKAVYIEKPPSTSISGCYRIMEIQQRTGVPLMVGMQLRYGYDYGKIKSILLSGELGAPKVFLYKEFRNPFIAGYEGWRLTKEGSGGMILEKNVHQFDLFSWYAESKLKRVTGFGGNQVIYSDHDILDHFTISLEYENGVKASITQTLFSPGLDDETHFYIVCEKGILIKTNDGIRIKKTGDEDFTLLESRQEHTELGHAGTEYNAYLAFAEYIKNGTRPYTGAEEGKDSVVAATAAELAIEKGIVVEISTLDRQD